MTVYRGLPPSRPIEIEKVLNDVINIIDLVKSRGDAALRELTLKFDGINLERIALDRDALRECCKDVDSRVAKAVEKLFDVLYEFHKNTLPKDVIVNVGGINMGYLWRSIYSVGVYVPGGKKTYPSTLLMAGVPAKIAGVKKIYVASPPMTSACVNPIVAYTAQLLEVEEVYNVGGAQAIAALAYGTESVKKVDKIVGPGNIYVQAAKFAVQNVVSIDGIEGPTELVVIADESSNAEFVALDMMAQAEHGKGTFVVLLTNSDRIASEVATILEKDVSHDFYIVKVDSIDSAVNIANELAPEHLSLHVSNPQKYIGRIVNAGAISVGTEPPTLIDYVGPNHILPTNRWARSRGALSIYDFLKPVSVIFDSANIDDKVLEAVLTLARYEGFEAHSQSVETRYGGRVKRTV
uniref:Histidinol dehydrogenase n=1 Tax=Ignisphaera aggregans TaxID=334771 RepID=A0A7C2ZVL0_9CREN